MAGSEKCPTCGRPFKKYKQAEISDEDWIKGIKSNPAFKGLDIDKELSKMDAWISVHTGKKKTRRFIINWLLRASASTPFSSTPKPEWEKRIEHSKGSYGQFVNRKISS